jgi:hypothetical protein
MLTILTNAMLATYNSQKDRQSLHPMYLCDADRFSSLNPKSDCDDEKKQNKSVTMRQQVHTYEYIIDYSE